jgi:hypothetical protein
MITYSVNKIIARLTGTGFLALSIPQQTQSKGCTSLYPLMRVRKRILDITITIF